MSNFFLHPQKSSCSAFSLLPVRIVGTWKPIPGSQVMDSRVAVIAGQLCGPKQGKEENPVLQRTGPGGGGEFSL